MALIVLCGHPCSGKSTFATVLQQKISMMNGSGSEDPHTCIIVDEPSLHLSRSDAYKDNFSEKNLRAALRSAVDRTLHTGAIVIADSNNFIKGFRYELWCAARAAKARYCLVHCEVTISDARKWNSEREDGYPEEIFEDLVRRFEYPNPKNRWDAPYFVIRPEGINLDELKREKDSVKLYEWPADLKPASTGLESMHSGIQNQSSFNSDEQAGQSAGSYRENDFDPAKKSNRGSKQEIVEGNLNPTPATSAEKLSATNLRHELDRATLQVVNAIIAAQGEGLGKVEVSDALSMRLNRSVSVAELRRLRQQFLRLTGSISGTQVKSAEAAQKLFVEHLKSLGV